MTDETGVDVDELEPTPATRVEAGAKGITMADLERMQANDDPAERAQAEQERARLTGLLRESVVGMSEKLAAGFASMDGLVQVAHQQRVHAESLADVSGLFVRQEGRRVAANEAAIATAATLEQVLEVTRLQQQLLGQVASGLA